MPNQSSSFLFKAISTLFICSSFIFAVNTVDAAQTSSTLDVRATVEATCLINTVQDIDFGTLIAGANTEYDARGRINYACTNGIRGLFSLDGGSTTGNVMDRAMEAADGSQLKYQLYTNRNYNNIFGDGTGGSRRVRSAVGRGISTPRNRNVFARITDADLVGVNPNSYSDIITVSFDF